MMWIWLLGAALLVFSMFWPLVWQVPMLLRRIALLAYFLFEAREEYRENRRQSVRADNSIPEETAGGAIGLKIMAGIVIAAIADVRGGLPVREAWPRDARPVGGNTVNAAAPPRVSPFVVPEMVCHNGPAIRATRIVPGVTTTPIIEPECPMKI